MGSYKAKRFLIDRIDERLGSVEKEIKFDKIAICVGAIITVVGLLLCILCGITHAGLFVLGLMLIMTGLAIMFSLTKELISDTKRAKQNK